MPRSVAEVRMDDTATCRYVLFIEGEPDAYTDDETGGLIGDGLDSWIGLSETQITSGGGSEVFGTRRVRGGLIVPDMVSFAIDIKSGQLLPSPASFGLLDVDDTLSYLFASEGKSFVELAQNIPPGTAALGTSVDIVGGGTTNPRGRYIGAERIGPSGQRRFCPALPYTLIGAPHYVAQHLPATWISDEPITFVGRMATLYRIYKVRPELDDSSATAWALWQDAHEAGDLVWWGTLRDAGNISAGGIWSIDCHGPDGMLRKTLGTRNTSRWMRIDAEPTVSDDERYVGIAFRSQSQSGAQFFYQASNFDHQFTTSDSRAELASDLDQWIEDAMSGGDVNARLTEDAFADWTSVDGDFLPDAGVYNDGVFHIRRVGMTENETMQFGTMMIAMHEQFWLRFGWEPWRQHQDGIVFDDLTRCRFQKLEAGDDFTPLGEGTVPSDGYWLAYFDTITPGASIWDSDYYANSGGGPREWYPMHTSAVFSLNPDGGQVVRLLDEEDGTLFLEGQPTAGVDSADHTIDGDEVDNGRWFAIKAERIKIEDDPATEEIEVSEKETVHLVALGEWVAGTTLGSVSGGTAINPAIYLSRFESPRTFGWNNLHISEPLAGKVEGKGEVYIAPLHAYHYTRGTKPFELAPYVWMQVMLSTGTADGYDAPHDEGGEFTGGDNNSVPSQEFVDTELADMGLGVPSQLCVSPTTLIASFDAVPGGATGHLNRVRHAYIGQYQAADVIDSLMRPRRMSWSLNGKRFGVFKLGPVSPEDADMTITEDDLYGPPGDPTSVIPVQTLRATGQLDRVDLGYRNDPETGKPALEMKVVALDDQARGRTGELVETMTDPGLCPTRWFGSVANQAAATGVGDWQSLFHDLWARETATFLAAKHYSLEMVLARHLGQDAMPGTSAAITNQWPINPRGGRGITSATGRIVRADHMLHEHSTKVECIVFVGGAMVHYSPAVLVGRVNGTTVEWYDYNGIEADGRGFVEPEWSDTGGEMQVDFYQRSGTTWALAFSCGVVSVDLDARTAVLDAAPGTALLRDKDTWMVARSWVNQNANEWPRAVYGVQADDDQTVGDGVTKAPAFVG